MAACRTQLFNPTEMEGWLMEPAMPGARTFGFTLPV